MRTVIEGARAAGKTKSENSAAREVRPSSRGLILLYPISRYSGYGTDEKNRVPLFANPDSSNARDLIGLAVSFPKSNMNHAVEAYLQGTVDWRPIE